MIDTTIKPTFRYYFLQLWEYRELLQNLVKRDIKAQTKQSLLGYLWILAPPLFQMGLFSLLFQAILKIQMTESIPYPIYLYCTLLPWQMFAGMVTQGTTSIVRHGGLIKQVYFPKEVVVLSSMSAEAFKTLIASTILIGLMVYYGISVGINLLWLPLLVGIQILFSLGLILPLAALNAAARDISKGLGIVLPLWMGISPVLYPLEKVPEAYRGLYLMNPMAVIIQSYRQVILENSPPDALSLTIVGLVAIALFVVSYHLFKRAEGSLADII